MKMGLLVVVLYVSLVGEPDREMVNLVLVCLVCTSMSYLPHPPLGELLLGERKRGTICTIGADIIVRGYFLVKVITFR